MGEKRSEESNGMGWGGDTHKKLVSIGTFCLGVNNFCWREKTCWGAKFQVFFLFLVKSRFIYVALE